jgi:hypothetical protein
MLFLRNAQPAWVASSPGISSPAIFIPSFQDVIPTNLPQATGEGSAAC